MSLLLVALALGALLACGGDADGELSSASADETPVTRVECVAPEDCVANLGPCRVHRCVEGRCEIGLADVGSACTAPGGSVCNDEGRCVACLEDGDCPQNQACSPRANCVPESCANGVLDPGETDIDCGGPACEPCLNGDRCEQARDCESGYCGEAVAPGSDAATGGDADGGMSNEPGSDPDGEPDAATGSDSDGEAEAATGSDPGDDAGGRSERDSDEGAGAVSLRCAPCRADADCASGEICDPRTSTCEADLCVPNPCTRGPAPACEGNVLVTRDREGTCTNTLLTVICAYPVQERRDCAAEGLVCSGGACVDSASAPATLRLEGGPVAMDTNATVTLRIEHVGGDEEARDVRLDLRDTPLQGRLQVNSSDCARIRVGASCNLRVSSGAESVPPTLVSIEGANTNRLELIVEILPAAPGDRGGGGVLVRAPAEGRPGLVAAIADLEALQWATGGFFVGANSLDNGRLNTQRIVTQVDRALAPAAAACDALAVDASGSSPCEAGAPCFDDWYLPARTELLLLRGLRALLGGFSDGFYWSSTEAIDAPSELAESVNFANGLVFTDPKTIEHRVRCVRMFR